MFQASPIPFRIGYGEDAHRLLNPDTDLSSFSHVASLHLAGIEIPDSPHKVLAHSDGDVVLHALSDALLSAFALKDIGHYFPPSDMRYKNLDSSIILAKVLELLEEKVTGLNIYNLSLVIILDRPKLGPFRESMQSRLAKLLNLANQDIGISFKTSEGLAPQHVQARVSLLLSGSLR
ncbi:MAG: 2-C-methyl-D-erythritol 2,4-cyclodiphosphate synthase [Deinococcales bacterium]